MRATTVHMSRATVAAHIRILDNEYAAVVGRLCLRSPYWDVEQTMSDITKLDKRRLDLYMLKYRHSNNREEEYDEYEESEYEEDEESEYEEDEEDDVYEEDEEDDVYEEDEEDDVYEEDDRAYCDDGHVEVRSETSPPVSTVVVELNAEEALSTGIGQPPPLREQGTGDAEQPVDTEPCSDEGGEGEYEEVKTYQPTDMCFYYQRDRRGCRNFTKCRYVHAMHPPVHIPDCKEWGRTKGKCRVGNKCPWYHANPHTGVDPRGSRIPHIGARYRRPPRHKKKRIVLAAQHAEFEGGVGEVATSATAPTDTVQARDFSTGNVFAALDDNSDDSA